MVVMMSDVEVEDWCFVGWIAASLCSASCLKMIKIRFGKLVAFMAILETSFVSEELILALLSRTNSFY